MADVTYTVEVEYLTKGNLASGFGGIAGNMTAIQQSAKQFNRSMTKVFSNTNYGTQIFGRMQPAAAAAGTSFGTIFNANMLSALTTSGIDAVASGVAHVFRAGLVEVNAELERLGITLATSFAGTGQVKDFNQGLVASKQLIKDMRIDSRELPGEFKDLASIFQRINTPAANAGMSIQDTRKLAANAMAIGVGNGLNADVVGREVGDFIQGNVRKNQPMLKYLLNLHESPTELNAMDQPKRVARLQKALGMVEGTKEFDAATSMRAAFQASWIGLWSTLKDNMRTVLGALTGGVFESIKGALGRFNEWFAKNETRIVQWAESVGAHLDAAFRRGLVFAEKMLPIIEKTGTWLSQRGEESTLGRDAGVATAGLVGIRLAMPLLGEAIGTGLAAAFSAVGLGPIIAIAAALGGVIMGMTNDLGPLYADFHILWAAMKGLAGDAMVHLKHAFLQIWPLLRRVAEIVGLGLLSALTIIVGALAAAAEGVDTLTTALMSMLDKMRTWIHEHIPNWGNWQALIDPDRKPDIRDIKKFDRDVPTVDLNALPNAKPPVHHTTIHRVEINVNGNGDPNRVAKRTLDIMNDFARHPKSFYNSGGPRFSNG